MTLFAGIVLLVVGLISLYKCLWKAHFGTSAHMHVARDLALVSLSGFLIVAGGLVVLEGLGLLRA